MFAPFASPSIKASTLFLAANHDGKKDYFSGRNEQMVRYMLSIEITPTCVNSNPDEGPLFATLIAEFLNRPTKTTTPRLLLFSGHGSPHGWHDSDRLILSYQSLVPMLVRHNHTKGRLIIVNVCCYSGTLIECLRPHIVNQERILVITGPNRTSHGGLVCLLVNSWARGRSFPYSGAPGDPRLYGNRRLQHYYMRSQTVRSD
jgi:hypothetical protein